MDEDAGGRGSAGGRDAQPLVGDQEDEVAEQPQQEDQLGEGLQQQPVPLAEVPGAGGEPGQQVALTLPGPPPQGPRSSHVVEDSQDHPEGHVGDPQDDGHLHLEGVEEAQVVDSQAPDLGWREGWVS